MSVAIRWAFVVISITPLAILLGWIAAGEADPSSITNPDLRNLFDGDIGGFDPIWAGWTTRILAIIALALSFRRYLARVHRLVPSLLAGGAFAALSWGFVALVMSYPEAEARLSLTSYKHTFEDASFWLLPYLLAIALVAGLSPVIEEVWQTVPPDPGPETELNGS